MTRRIKKSNAAIAVLDAVCPHVLSDTSGFAFGNAAFANKI